MDFFEFLITALPEGLINHLSELMVVVLYQLQNRKDNINKKANDLLNVAQEVLSADLLLPHLVAIIEELSKEILDKLQNCINQNKDE